MFHKDGELFGRAKLMKISIENDNILEVWFSKFEKEYKEYNKKFIPKEKMVYETK